jgi:hypothetical protein
VGEGGTRRFVHHVIGLNAWHLSLFVNLHHDLPYHAAGGDSDSVVDVEAVGETAAWFGVQGVVWERTAHDFMLDTRWQAAADDLKSWLGML